VSESIHPDEPRRPDPAERPPTRDTALRRLHPLTPLLRSWIIVAAALGALWNQISSAIEGRLFGSPPGSSEGDVAVPIWLVLLAIALVVALAYGYLYWRFTTYGIVGNVLRIDSGVLFRRSRQVPLDRLQAVDVVRPLVARIAGVAELRLEVAGGGSTEAPLAYLSLSQAAQLRAELLARAAGIDSATPEAPERAIAIVPLRHLVLGSLLSPATVLFVAAVVGGGAVVGLSGEAAAISPFIPAVIGAAIAAGRRFVVNYGFTLADSPDGLRIRKGLLDTRAQTLPPGRVQAVRITEPLLWRPTGLVRVEVNVAGYATSHEHEQERSSVLLPVGPRPLALMLAGWVLASGAGSSDGSRLPVDLSAIGQRRAAPGARFLRPIGWQRLSAGGNEELFLAREGWARRETLAIPYAKPQSLRLTQGPLQRRLSLVTVHLDSTPGPVSVRALHRDAAEGRRMLDEAVGLEQAARRRAAPDRWLASGE
jgi:putative membrane protein